MLNCSIYFLWFDQSLMHRYMCVALLHARARLAEPCKGIQVGCLNASAVEGIFRFLDFKIQGFLETLVPVPDGDLGDTGCVGYHLLGPLLIVHDTGDV